MDFLHPTNEKRKEIRAYFDENFPSVSRMRLGRSILGEDIDMYRLGHGRKNVLYVGAHHGSEHITASLLYYFLDFVRGSGQQISSFDKELYFNSFTIFVIPMLNPDGCELSMCGAYENPLSARQARMAQTSEEDVFLHWQANSRGVDLNHNYSTGFAEYKKIEHERGIRPGRSLYSGEYPESEPESRALASLARSVDFSLVVSLHSQGEVIYSFPENTASAPLSAAERILGYRREPPCDTACYGGFCDYTAGELGIPSLTLEVGHGENPLPDTEYYKIRERMALALVTFPTVL